MNGNPREILNYAKHAGWVDVAPGVRLATREDILNRLKRIPRVIEVSPGHKIEIFKDADFSCAPYWFFVEPEDPADDKIQFFSTSNEEKTLIAIEACGNL
ncbi:MAG: hypothetical protein LBH42_10420 [Treponema sp.]|jgi:hypothetical protein|nr:hypothetical protein [Treponema sp.]